jgi:2-polyprenyl-3-methyl-5-hydroxy-6-metoxy-1,4-benzoquinol methylase
VRSEYPYNTVSGDFERHPEENADLVLDRSHGYEEYADIFIRSRSPRIGLGVVRDWAGQFTRDAEVLELGCGHGVISEVLVEAGLTLFAVDASPTLLRTFHKRFPHVETDCSAAEESTFFERTFDGVVAWGLLFLLEEDAQRCVLTKVGKVLRPGGRLLFTAPREAIEWIDVMTARPSRSLGAVEYERFLRGIGLEVSSGMTDEGENYCYYAIKR